MSWQELTPSGAGVFTPGAPFMAGAYADEVQHFAAEAGGWFATGIAPVSTARMPANPVTALAGDTMHELVWVGSHSGRVASYFTGSLERFSSFNLHHSPVRQLLVSEAHVASVSAAGVHLTTRGGVCAASFRSIEDAACGAFSSHDHSKMLVASASAGLTLVDMRRLKLLSEHELEGGAHVLRHTRGLYACGQRSGGVVFVDPRLFKPQRSLAAHTGGLTDMDAHDHYLVTCGLALARGVAARDLFVKVFDVRMFRALAPVSFHAAVAVGFDPARPLTTLLCAAGGLVAELDLTGSLVPQPRLYGGDAHGPALCAMAIAPTGEALWLCDESSCLRAFADRPGAQTSLARAPLQLPTPYVAPLDGLPEHHPLSCAYMPFVDLSTGTHLLSTISPAPTYVRGLPPAAVADELVQAARFSAGVGALSNPGKAVRRNVAQSAAHRLAALTGDALPSTPSAVDARGFRVSPAKADGGGRRGGGRLPRRMPGRYQPVEIPRRLLTATDVDVGSHFNKSRLPALENTFSNCYTNALLLMLWASKPLRTVLLSHLCAAEFCLACELGFLCHMLDASGGTAAQASNVTRTLRHISVATALGLLEPDPPNATTPYAQMTKTLARFVLDQVGADLASAGGAAAAGWPSSGGPVIDALYGCATSVREQCLGCAAETVKRESVPTCVFLFPREDRQAAPLHDVQFRTLVPPPAQADTSDTAFCSALTQSLHKQLSARVWCPRCAAYALRTQTVTVTSLPPTLVVSCAPHPGVPGEAFFWYGGELAAAQERVPGVSQGAVEAAARLTRAEMHPAPTLPLAIYFAHDASRQPPLTAHPYEVVCAPDDDDEAGAGRPQTRVVAEHAEAIDASDIYDLTAVVLFVHTREQKQRNEPGHVVCLLKIDEPPAGAPAPAATTTTAAAAAATPAAAAAAAAPGAAKSGRKGAKAAAAAAAAAAGVATAATAATKTPAATATAAAAAADASTVAPAGPASTSAEGADAAPAAAAAAAGSGSGWFLFNDMLVTPVPLHEVVRHDAPWRVPCVVQYTRRALPKAVEALRATNPITREVALATAGPGFSLPRFHATKCRHVALDAEFVALADEEKDVRSDGSRRVVKHRQLALARVSVLHGDEGPDFGKAFIDEYICTREPVADYLTQYSGIRPGDLDPAQSRHRVVSLKAMYVKLRYLVDAGFVFIGHGLKKDFRMVNIVVPREQILDTVELFYRDNERKIALRFLVRHLLGLAIQLDSHDSVEDARSTLMLYRKYRELVQAGQFESALDAIYDAGRASDWRV